MRLSKYSLSLILILLSGCVASEQAAGPPAPPPPSVALTQVRKVAISDSTEYVGRTESVSFVDLRARVTGFLKKQTFVEGADVKEGDLLYLIEQEPYQAAVEIAEASVAQTQATLENAEKFLQRLNTVKDTGGTSKANVEAAESKVAETKGLLQERRARLVQAKLDLSYTEIRAPISGRIGRTAVYVGNLVGPESGVLATIVRLDPMWVSFPISERDYLKLQETVAAGRKSGEGISQLIPTIRLVDGTMFRYKGRIDFQDNRVDRSTGTITLRATFPNPQLLLRPGQFVTVVQTERNSTYRLVVPQAAVQTDQVGPFVFTMDSEKKAQVRRIKTGNEVGTNLIVTEGLSEGESVISEGIQKVTPGSRVNPVANLPESEGGSAGAQ
jgi:membrane fusion protein (multidrug efflux system)